MKQLHKLFTYLLVFLSVAASYVPTNHRQYQHKPAADSPANETAVYLLDSSIEELKEIDRFDLRVSLAESIVRSLAKYKPERCRQMLDSLFSDAINLGDGNHQAKNQRRVNLNATVKKIIQIAAQFDRELAQSYIDRYLEKQNLARGSSDKSASARSATADLYSSIALEIGDNDPALAASIAQQSLSEVITPQTLEFLVKLRSKDPSLARTVFDSALQSVRNRQCNDVNEMLLLYSYVFSPSRVPFISPQGIGARQIPFLANQDVKLPIAPDPASAAEFLQISIAVLSEASRYNAGDVSRLVMGPIGDYYFLKIIESQEPRFFPGGIDASTRLENSLIGAITSEQFADSRTNVDRWNRSQAKVNQDSESGGMESLVRKADSEQDTDRRDQLYYNAATSAVNRKNYDLAMDIAGKISPSVRDEAKQFIAFSIAEQSLGDGKIEKAMEWSKKDNDLVRRSYILSLAAKSTLNDSKHSDKARAAELLNEAEATVSKLNYGQERACVLIGAAAIYSKFDDVRARELFREAIESTNKSESFEADIKINRVIKIGGFGFFYQLYDCEASFAEVISVLAARDFNSTLFDVRSLKNRVVRLKATVALCSGILQRHQS